MGLGIVKNHIVMKLGNFSLSLSVKDLETSKTFYEDIGFTLFHGDMSMKYLIMKNGNCTIGLFQDMFEGNILTFNPGWDENANPVDDYTDCRELQRRMKRKGIEPETEVDEKGSGPGSFMVRDPDGNAILIDQHV